MTLSDDSALQQHKRRAGQGPVWAAAIAFVLGLGLGPGQQDRTAERASAGPHWNSASATRAPERPLPDRRFAITVAASEDLAAKLSGAGLSRGQAQQISDQTDELVDRVNSQQPVAITAAVGPDGALRSLEVNHRNERLAWQVGSGRLVPLVAPAGDAPAGVNGRIIVVSGLLKGTLFGSLRAEGLSAASAVEITRLAGARVDLSRDLATGERFIVGLERSGSSAQAQVRFVRLPLRAAVPLQLFRLADDRGQMRWVDSGGVFESRAFLKTPLDATRVSSGFGLRRHPVLGYSRMHRGIDYAAATGTPVAAAAVGTVVRAGWNGGYGRFVAIRHADGWQTQYAHLSSIAVRPGQTVSQGQILGAVGSTGMSTGPHLHFELLRTGRAVDPSKVNLMQRSRMTIPGADIARLRTAMIAAISSRRLESDPAG